MHERESWANCRFDRYSPRIEPRRSRRADWRCSSNNLEGLWLRFPASLELPKPAIKSFSRFRSSFCRTFGIYFAASAPDFTRSADFWWASLEASSAFVE